MRHVKAEVLDVVEPMNKTFFANKIRFFAKWGLFFAKWGLLFAGLYVRKSPAVLLNLGDPIIMIAQLHHCRFPQPNFKLLSLSAQLERNA